MPVLADLDGFEARRDAIACLGYRWWSEYGLPGRRYCTRDDDACGRRVLTLHAFAEGSDAILRHLAFHDYLRPHPAIAAVYEAEKRRCAALHADDPHHYTDCKNAWIRRVEAEAMALCR